MPHKEDSNSKSGKRLTFSSVNRHYKPGHNIFNFTMLQYKTDSPEGKRNLISSVKIMVHKLSHKLQNGSTLRI